MQPQTFKPFLISIQSVINDSCHFAATNIFTAISKNIDFIAKPSRLQLAD
jgi:hypothetical protein